MDAETRFEELAEELGAERAQMFGKRALKRGSKAFACLLGDTVAFKLIAGTPEHAAALGLEGAALFDPSGRNRPMKDWVAVPFAHAARWADFGRTAMERLPG